MPANGEAGFQQVFGLWVEDAVLYAEYRKAMLPILTEKGGCFRYDFEIGRTLKAENGEAINRVFVLWFPSEQLQEEFFADPRYKAVRAQYFDSSVRSVTKLA